MPRQLPHITSFLDNSFNEQHTRNYVLSVAVNAYGMDFALYQPIKNKVIGLVSCQAKDPELEDDTNNQLEDMLATAPWLGFPFSRVCMVYHNNLSTLIPNPLFSHNNAALYLEFNHAFKTGTRILYDTVKHTDAVLVYGLPGKFVEKAKTTWPNVQLKHAATTLIETLHILVKNRNDNNILFVNVAKNSFELVYFKENKLHFYNQFTFHTKYDFIYFLLAGIEQLELNPETVSLQLLGMIDKSDAHYEMIYSYIRNIDFVGRNSDLSYSYVLDELKPHGHFVLFNNLQCE